MTTGGDLGGDTIGPELLADQISSLTIAAHELKSPLATVRQLALELQSYNIRHEALDHIVLTTERSLRLVKNLTTADRLQSELFPTTTVNPTTIVHSVNGEIQPLYVAYGKQLSYRRPRHLPLVMTNSELLRRIVLNFADNALYYGGKDGSIELFNQLIKQKNVVRFGVRDYGPALPVDVWRSLKKGTVTSQIVAKRPSSSGLGLQISGQFARAIGAEIGAIRHRNGATFFVDVPISHQLRML